MALSPARIRHEESADCWCEPVLDHTSSTGVRLYIHREYNPNGTGDHPPAAIVHHVRQVTELIRPDLGGRDEMHLSRLACSQAGALEDE